MSLVLVVSLNFKDSFGVGISMSLVLIVLLGSMSMFGSLLICVGALISGSSAPYFNFVHSTKSSVVLFSCVAIIFSV